MWYRFFAHAVQIAQAAPAGQATPGAAAPAPNTLVTMGPMLLLCFGVMYFVMIRPQQKRDKERRDLLSALAKGDEVITTGGICGSITGISDSHVVLRVDDNVKIEFVRSAISQVTSRKGDAEKAK